MQDYYNESFYKSVIEQAIVIVEHTHTHHIFDILLSFIK